MRRAIARGLSWGTFLGVLGLGVCAFGHPNYVGTPAPVVPSPGPGIPAPTGVVGKEYVPTATPAFGIPGGNQTVAPTPHAPDLHQVTAWDASFGAGPPPPPGMADSSRDYTPFLPGPVAGSPVDSLANHEDLFYAPPFTKSVVANTSALLFSVTSDSAFGSGPTAAPILAEPIGGGGIIWAPPAVIAHTDGPHAANGLPPLGGDLDGLEVWGPDAPAGSDSDRFSLMADPDPGGGKVSVWAQIGGPGGAVAPLVPSAAVAAAMEGAFGYAPGTIPVAAIDLDGLMMWDDDDFVLEPGIDNMLFSVRPFDPDGGGPLPLIDGGEIFDTNFMPGGTTFLLHGGHLWDTAFPVMLAFGTLSENVDGLEAVATPEPGSISLLLVAGALALRRSHRRAIV